MVEKEEYKSVIVIIGITGQQGGSVANYLLKTNKFNIKGITRNINSEKSIYFKNKGIEMIECDLSNYEKLKKIFEGTDYVYSVTNTEDKDISSDLEKEVEYGTNIVNAACSTSIKFLIWSSLPFVNNKDIYSYNNKNKIEQYIRKKNIKAVYLYMGFYMSNFTTIFKPILKNEVVSFSLPIIDVNTKLTLIDIETDLGKVVFNVLENKDEYDQKIVHVACEELTINEIIDQFEKITKRKTLFEKINIELPEEYKLMFELWKDGNYYVDKTNLKKVYKLNDNMVYWKDWIKKNKEKII
jgi:nucleoside-diphosphate-sugar epimerase